MAVHGQIAQTGKPLCGQTGTVQMSMLASEVTCRRCQSIRSKGITPVERVDGVLSQQAAAQQEQNHTRREVIAYLLEGDTDAAAKRLWVGYQRQARILGLGKALREMENAS